MSGDADKLLSEYEDEEAVEVGAHFPMRDDVFQPRQ
jgi:hypothetical protein